MSRRHLASIFIAVPLITGGFTLPSQGQTAQSCQIGTSVVLAVNSARTGTDVSVTSGDVVVNQLQTGPTLGNGFSLYIDRRSAVLGSIKADRIRIFQQTTIDGSAAFNQLTNDGTILGGQSSPLPLPVFSPLPPFHEAVFRGTVQNITVAASTTRVLTPGEYGDIVVATAGNIVFTGGEYTIRSIDATGDDTVFTFNAASEVRIANKLRTRRGAVIGPAAGSGLSAAGIVFYVGGINGTDGELNSTPEAARIGSDGAVAANFYVPNGTLRFEVRAVATGAFIARDVQIDSRGELGLASAFANRAPAAATQDVNTNGAEPLLITLTARDPEGSDLVFAIEGSGLQFPARGSLGAVSQGPIPFPGNPPGCNPDNVPGCVPPDPPRTSATVVYTPSTGANEENSFVFSATDACGNKGVATVRINPPGDQGQPPVLLVVDATDVLVETPNETPRSITLVAGAPPAATLTFAIQSLPAHGTLKDSGGVTIGSVPYALPTRKVTYTPGSGFTGLDSFLFKATGSVGGSDTATVAVSVFERPELAENQSLAIGLNEPVLITLHANSGGTGTPADTRVTLYAKKQVDLVTGTSVAGNVSDADADGLGDARDDLPGATPVLVAAGVDVNLGGPSGTVSDPDSDASPSPNGDPDPDVISATASSDGTNLNLQVRFKAGTFDPLLTRAQFVLDTDQNPATGHPGSDSLCVNDNGIIGVEFLVNLGADLGTSAEVLSYLGTCNSFAFAGNGTTTFVTDGMNATVPLAVLGGDNGQLNFKVVISEQVGPGSFTGILDYAPDVGLAAGQSRSGIRGVARIQMEWDVSALPGAEDIESAEVTLSTVRGTVDALDTFFFAGTAEQDGLLAASDFQAPAAQISGVTMPVPAGSLPGEEGTFVFSVTNQLKAARTAGRNFFSVQGRVNEALAGGGFQRGLQVRSTATGNLSTNKEPKLNVVTTGTQTPQPVFKITALPLHGLLSFAGSPVVVNQTFLTPPTLLYTPTFGFTGNDAFVYQVAEGGLIDHGTVSIGISSIDGCAAVGRPPGCSPL
jgi:hypothetical protein